MPDPLLIEHATNKVKRKIPAESPNLKMHHIHTGGNVSHLSYILAEEECWRSDGYPHHLWPQEGGDN